MKTITELLSDVAFRQSGVPNESEHLIDQEWFKNYTQRLVDLAAEHCANHVRNMPSRGGFKFAERSTYVNQEEAVELIKSLFNRS